MEDLKYCNIFLYYYICIDVWFYGVFLSKFYVYMILFYLLFVICFIIGIIFFIRGIYFYLFLIVYVDKIFLILFSFRFLGYDILFVYVFLMVINE